MIVFHGGLNEFQVRNLEKEDPIILNRVYYDDVIICKYNTFDYHPDELYQKSFLERQEYISNDMYEKQYLFFSSYLKPTLEYCVFKSYYIFVCDLDEEILKQFAGVGDYGFFRMIEYRVPRAFIKKENIREFLIYDGKTRKEKFEQRRTFKEKYREYYEVSPDATYLANQFIKDYDLDFNGREKELKRCRRLKQIRIKVFFSIYCLFFYFWVP